MSIPILRTDFKAAAHDILLTVNLKQAGPASSLPHSFQLYIYIYIPNWSFSCTVNILSYIYIHYIYKVKAYNTFCTSSIMRWTSSLLQKAGGGFWLFSAHIKVAEHFSHGISKSITQLVMLVSLPDDNDHAGSVLIEDSLLSKQETYYVYIYTTKRWTT